MGGESAALARLKYYLFESNLIATYFDSRNGMLGALGRLSAGAGLAIRGGPLGGLLRAGPAGGDWW